MSKADEVKFDIKVVINKDKTKVLFVEAGSDFTDVLLSFLLLPLGTIVKVLKKHYGDEAPVIGSLNTLYDGLENLDVIHFYSEDSKQLRLNPINESKSYFVRLKFNYTDPSCSYSGEKYIGFFTKSEDSFIISDDLQMMPTGYVINTLSKLSIAITDMDGAETRTETIGFKELMDLLKETLISHNPLSTVLLRGSKMHFKTVNYEQRHQLDKETISLNSKKMVLKVMIQKSTFKLLFAQADQDFINFLFALLILPLGKVELYLGGNTGIKNIDNMYRSIEVDNFDKYLYGESFKDHLLDPPLPDNSCSTNEFYHLNFGRSKYQFPVKGQRIFMVSDDLTVAPMTITSGLSKITDELKISYSDVTELEMQVGLEEGLSILKAALTSTTALTDGLIKPMLKKPKQER